MAPARPSKAKTTKPATKPAEATTAENVPAVEPAPVQPAPASDEQFPAAGGDDNGGTTDPQAQPQEGASQNGQTTPEPQTQPALASYPGPGGEDVPFDTLWVKARKGGFRRAGHAFSEHEQTELAVADLTEDQVAALLEESRLIVNVGVKEG